ncbi:biliverdin-producing heme oxygenase [Roseomonas xinghualingensis]|uniref:biliverdin-producing heme oxygenase n=1 Tax=Roseomonas xinghualingensis TaxID=2986475 RepID=UPI0021F15487|nr:biliverdin-producing heme oxygenase [Roseomonas sp. SXEYE001]MCV4208427.1 biliverdin-producing heme oxygenase [Roseomonas sp. SXEYE001]
MPSIRERLRAETRPEHERLENGLRLTDPGLTLERYRVLLARFHGFWSGWEPRMAAVVGDEDFLAPRRRLHLLREDLRALGAATDGLPVCEGPAIRDRGEAFGSLYVMEGSTLGGRVIVKRLGALGLSPETGGCRYFAGYGAATGAMWNRFVERLEAEAHEESAPAIIQGARATFATLGDWLLAG